jgi:hypothetical protein
LVEDGFGQLLQNVDGKALRSRDAPGQGDHARLGNDFQYFTDGVDAHFAGAVGQQFVYIIVPPSSAYKIKTGRYLFVNMYTMIFLTT